MNLTAYEPQIEAFRNAWPANNLHDVRQVSAEFDRSGDLIDLTVYGDDGELEPDRYDGPAMVALLNDLKGFDLPPCLDFEALRTEYNMTGDGDAWGQCMAWSFAAIGELYERGETIPDEWHYRPSPLGGRDPDAYETPICAAATTEALWRMARVLVRMAAILRARGEDY